VLSDLNMRKRKTIEADFVHSIKVNGVVQALTVAKNEADGNHQVVAGRRRWLALKKLEKKGDIASDALIPCTVTSIENARSYSIIENLHRLKPHPTEYYQSIKKLEEEGVAKKEICSSLNLSSVEYDRIIRLSNLHPKIFRAYATGKLSEAQVHAFAGTDDRKKQIEIWAQSSYDDNITPFQIKRMISTGLTSRDSVARYVGMKVYRAKGGTSTHDLFEDIHYLNDNEIIIELAKEKLQKNLDEFTKSEPEWKWTTIYVPNIQGEDPKIHCHLRGKQRKRSAEQKATINELQSIITDLQNIEENRELTDEEDQRWDATQQAIDDAEDRINSENEYFLKKEMQNSGVILSIGEAGQLKFNRGVQTREDISI